MHRADHPDPGKGILLRKTQPMLEAMTPQEAQLPIRQVALTKVQSPGDDPRNFPLYYHPHSFSRILPGIVSILKRGYRLNLRSTDVRLDQIFQLFLPLSDDADLNVYFHPDL